MRILYLLLITCLSTLVYTESAAQNKKVIDEDSHYVVIGAFNIYKHAVNYANTAKKQYPKVELAFNENKKLYYVFITKTNDRAAAIEEAKTLQSQSQYPDAWVYGKPSEIASLGIDVNPETNKETAITPSDKPTNAMSAPAAASSATFSTSTIAAPSNSSAQEGQKDESGKWYFFKVYSSVTGDSVSGNIDLINMETNKKSASYKTNKSVVIKPTNKSGEILFACEILGYRPIKKNLNFNNPLASAEVTMITEDKDQFVLPFELVRLKKGDVAVMYDLFFYKDAAIIRSESRSEVGLLVDMMKENLKYKILLHGHTNGGGSGKIITVGADKNFFSLTGSKDGFGSAMKLSEARAEVVKEYLVAQGIDEKRIEVKSWGGKKPLYDVEHALAQSNVRVEVEILED